MVTNPHTRYIITQDPPPVPAHRHQDKQLDKEEMSPEKNEQPPREVQSWAERLLEWMKR